MTRTLPRDAGDALNLVVYHRVVVLVDPQAGLDAGCGRPHGLGRWREGAR